MELKDLLKENRLIIFDGAMGTSIQNCTKPIKWDAFEGCNEYLNLSNPDIIYDIHCSFLEAGADIIETNTFGANEIILNEYHLEKECYNINRKAIEIARKATSKYNAFIAGSIGPTNKLPSLLQTSFDELCKAYKEQVRAFLDLKVDLIIVETCQDLLQVKAILFTIFESLKAYNLDIPVMLSLSLQDNGTMLLGSNIEAIVALAEMYPLFSIGFNCSVGPDKLYEPLKELSEKWSGLISLMPNAGLPKNVEGKLIYDLSPEAFSQSIKHMCDENLIDIIGGCCGTTPEYISELKNVLSPYKRRKTNKITYLGKGSSLFSATLLDQEPKPAIIAERANVNGSKNFRELLMAENFESMLQTLKDEEDYAHFLDLSVAFPGRDEILDLRKIVQLANKSIIKPLVIDSTNPDAIIDAMKNYGGKPIINSVHFEDGGVKLRKIFEAVHLLPACVIALCIDEAGMALTTMKKLEVAKRIYNTWVNEYKYRPEDLIIDPLTFSIGSGDKSLQFAALETLKAIKLIKEELPGIKTILGVSNVSFGLSKNSRPFLNSVFLREAVNYGLDLAIIDPKKIIPEYEINEEKQSICLKLIYGERDSLINFINYFSNAKDIDVESTVKLNDEELIKQKIIKGDQREIEELIERLLKKYSAIDIINNLLLPSMKEVGDLFGAGKILLPFVLASAETMKRAIEILKPYLEKEKVQEKGTIILATVRGDVHDIGKNLVDIILSNNGYNVINLGIKVPAEEIINKYKETKADAIGLSGLLVQSAYIMKENIEIFKKEDINCKILLGGAALTKSFVDNECAVLMPDAVFYCKDAFDAIKYLEDAKVYKKAVKIDSAKKEVTVPEESLDTSILKPTKVPTPPFIGYKVVENINIEDIFRLLNKLTLYTARWGYTKKEMSDEEYDTFLKKVAKKEYEIMKKQIIEEQLIKPKVIYGYFKCKAHNNFVKIYNNEDRVEVLFEFPRQKKPPYMCIADFFLDEKDPSFDIIALQVVTLGTEPTEFLNKLFESQKYKEYFMFHGLFAEITESLAELWHRKIRIELNIEREKSNSFEYLYSMKYQGKRYSFGYPSCPDLKGNYLISKLLPFEKIGVTINDDYLMVPEYTTSAFILHNENAKYFTLV
jgi:5-methyltetrahydrofolate--homocysteine methyltransferase